MAKNTIGAVVRAQALIVLFGCAAIAYLHGCTNIGGGNGGGDTVPLKEAKLNIEHNATDEDTGFQGAIDSEGWERLDVVGPEGVVLTFEGRGKLQTLGITELFFETVEPANADVSLDDMLSMLPEGQYTIAGTTPGGERTEGTALLTHDIPAGPVLLTPAEGATVPSANLVMSWAPVTQTITGDNVTIIRYQLIIEKDEPVHAHAIGKLGLSIYLPASVTSLTVPNEFLEPGTHYLWEVLAIEESGNQTLSSSEFTTQVADAVPGTVPDFSAARFTNPTSIDNPFFPLTPGTVLTYQGETSDGTERIVIEVLDETRVVMGVTTRVVRDRVTIDGVIVEDTFDWYAQDDAGNVWYMGEEVDDYNYDEAGNLIDITHGGVWEAGQDVVGLGVIAKPGFQMKASPEPGDSYHQEFYPGSAEDQGEVVAVNVPITLADGTMHMALQIRDSNPLNPDAVDEFKYYASGIGLILEEPVTGEERIELVSIE